TYYSKAYDKLDFSKLEFDKKIISDEDFNNNKTLNREEIFKKLNEKTLQIARELDEKKIDSKIVSFIDTNREAGELVDKGYIQPHFVINYIDDVLEFVEDKNSGSITSNPTDFFSGAFQQNLKVRVLDIYITSMGDFYRKTDRQKGARCYLQAVRLENARLNYLPDFTTVFPVSPSLERLTKLTYGSKDDSNYNQYILNKLKPYQKNNYEWILKNQLYITNVIVDEALPLVMTGPFGKVAGVVLERERKYMNDLRIKVLDEYAEDPCFFSGRMMAFTDKPSIMGNVQSVVMQKSYESYYTFLAYIKANRIMSALNLYWQNHGVFPEKLEEISPVYIDEVPADYFAADLKFKYKPEKGSYLLYSVGPDGADNQGGTPFNMKTGNGDIIFSLTQNETPGL
ncbi:MAG: hypothetical protein ACLFQV_08975, partial [Vulcanimicrobiota bacterium]